MAAPEAFESFTLMGGPLHRLGCRLGLVRGGVNPLPMGLALGGVLWIVLVILSLAEGLADRLFSLSLIAAHVRLIVAIPLFFLCEALLAPRLALLVHELVQSRVVPPGEVPALKRELARIARWRDSWLPEVVCLAGALALAWFAPDVDLLGASARRDPGLAAGAMPLPGLWYWFVCLTAFRFLAFRWMWLLLLQWHFLWRLSRLRLQLSPAHPDRVAGLGYLEVVQAAFVPLAIALSALQSAMLAEDLAAKAMTFEAAYPAVVVLLALILLLFVAPLAIFAPSLWRCRERGLAEYGRLGAQYAAQFDDRWLGGGQAGGDPLLGTADIQSLADLANSVSVVHDMRLVPVSRRLLLSLGCAALLPVLPLLLFQLPAAELAGKLLSRLLGV